MWGNSREIVESIKKGVGNQQSSRNQYELEFGSQADQLVGSFGRKQKPSGKYKKIIESRFEVQKLKKKKK